MLNRHLVTLLVIFLLVSTQSQAQRWSRFKNEVSIGVGASNFLGDLGGKTTGDGTRFGDFQFKVSRPAFTVLYKHRFHERFKFRANLAYGQVVGDDAYSNNEGRRNRNLNFKSPIVELAAGLEWYFLKENKRGSYTIKGMKGTSLQNISGYLFAGIGAFYFNPKGKNENGDWVNLSGLNTEGQGLPNGPEDYNNIAITMPLGFGLNYSIDRYWAIGVEYGVRMTSTDYIDDVSSYNYYQDYDLLLNSGGFETLNMADRRIEGQFKPNGRRGNPDNTDAYMFAFITISKRFKMKPGNRTRF